MNSLTNSLSAVGLVVKESSLAVAELVKSISNWCGQKSIALQIEARSAELLGLKNHSLAIEQIAQSAQVIIVLGGDGTLLGVGRVTAQSGPVLIGVNFGTLGFLTEIAPNEVIAALDSLLNNSARIVDRSLLSASCTRDGSKVFESLAVNDIIVQKNTSSRLIELSVFCDEHELMGIRADGLICATPLGSTAYSLAAGGSIAYPGLDVILMTPICAHSLTYRPIILPGTAKLAIYIPEYDGEVYLTADGQSSFSLQSGDKVEIAQSNLKMRLLESSSHDYFSRLRSKLNWGIPNREEG